MLDHETILVTGGAGFIGSSFIRFILQRSEFVGKIINVDALTYAGNPNNIPIELQNRATYQFVRGNIGDAALLEELWQKYSFTIIVHFAAESHVDRSIRAPSEFIHTNILGTVSLLEFTRTHPPVRMHHISTDEVFGSRESVCDMDAPYNPSSPYAASKSSADHFVMSYHKTYNTPVTLSYSSNNFGPYQYPEKFIPVVIRSLINKTPIPIYGEGKQMRDWIYVDDHVAGIWNFLKMPPSRRRVAFTGENHWSNLELVQKIIRIYSLLTGTEESHYKGLIQFMPDRPGHDYSYSLQKTEGIVDWNSSKSFSKQIEYTIAWYIHHRDWLYTKEDRVAYVT